jgi:poly-gamma-glutamate capsule biosynthesis protein CapA/YwtB (metallophosphatase superfamily)
MNIGTSLFVLASLFACTAANPKENEAVGKEDSAIARCDTTSATSQVRPDSCGRADTVTLAFVGDVMPGTTYPEPRLPEKDGATLFNDVKDILLRADVAAGNMEGALADSGSTTKGTGKYSFAFRIPTRYGRWLKEAGLDFMSVANNHSLDFGFDGVTSTEKTLNDNGIAFAGIDGRTESAIVVRNGIRFGFCAFGHNSYTVRHADLDNAKRIIQDLRNKADIVVVSFHGGAEGQDHNHLPFGEEIFLNEERGDLRNFAHFCIDNGADVVYGHGPHVVRAVELYNGHFIAYSLGNFCTPYGINIKGISGYAPVLELRLDAKTGTFLGGHIHSFIQQYGRGPREDKSNSVAKEMAMLTAADFPKPQIRIAPDGEINILPQKQSQTN